MKTRIIAKADIATIVREVGLDALMDQMIDCITKAIESYDDRDTHVKQRDGFQYVAPNVGLLEWMPIMHSGEVTTIKVVGYHPSNPDRFQIPTILSTISTYETTTGHLAGLADANFITALRTGATSAVASRVLARPSSSILGLIGCGAQAVSQLHAMLRVFRIQTVMMSDISAHAVESFRTRTASIMPKGVNLVEAPIFETFQKADIVCTTTSVGIGEGPLLATMETTPWLHVNAVGSDFPGKVELPVSFLARSLVCPDDPTQAAIEGECQQLQPEQIGPQLSQLVKNPDLFASSREVTTVFDSTGLALEDWVGMQMLLEYSDLFGLGVSVELEAIGDDPLDPYAFREGD